MSEREPRRMDRTVARNLRIRIYIYMYGLKIEAYLWIPLFESLFDSHDNRRMSVVRNLILRTTCKQASTIFSSTRARFDDLLLDNIRPSAHAEFPIRLKGDIETERRRRRPRVIPKV